MGKRQKRIFRAQLQEQQQAFLGQELCVVMTDARTLRGRARALEGEELHVLDLSRHLHRIPLVHVAEVVLDYEAEY